MKKILQLLAVSLLPFFAQAQLGNFEEVVYLKNGNIYRGVIIEQIPGVSLKVQSADRNVFAVKIEEVEKITREELKPAFPPHQPYGQDHHFMYNHKMAFDTTIHRKAGGVYLTFGPDAMAHSNFSGVGFELNLGGKIFNKRWTKHTKLGGDVFGFAGVMMNRDGGKGFQVGINGGPSIAFSLKHKRFIYLTPYIGLTAIATMERDYAYYDFNGNYIQENRRNLSFAAPVGLKFEVAIKKFFIGTNACIGASYGSNNNSFNGNGNGRGMGAYARAGINFGVKF